MNRPVLWIVVVYLFLTLLISVPGLKAFGAVSLTGTRLIFDGRFPEASIAVTNRSNHQVLIQAWLTDARDDDGDPGKAGGELPFVLTPHLSQLDGQGKQVLRLLYQGSGIAQDRESLLHLYVLEIPRRVEGRNQLSIAIRQRINVFYRPRGLPGDPAETPSLLRWTWSANGPLRISNPTAFHAALQNVKVGDVEVSDYLLLSPGANHEFALPASSPRPQRLSFSALTDYGVARAWCTQIHASESVNARLLDPVFQQPKEC